MRIEKNRDGTHKCWIEAREYRLLRDLAGRMDPRYYLTIRLGGESGIRSFEIPQLAPNHVMPREGTVNRIRVPKGKDTRQGEGEPRNALLNDDLMGDLRDYMNHKGISKDSPFLDVTPRTIQNWVKYVAREAAEQTGDDDFLHFSSHDLRRYFSQYYGVVKDMDRNVLMKVGGWKSLRALRPYLNQPTEDQVDEEVKNIEPP